MRHLSLLCFAAVILLRATDTADDAVRSISSALRARHYQDALQLAATARRQWPQEVRLFVLEGMALSGLGKDQDALAAFRGALSIAPDYVPALEAAAETEYKLHSADAIAHLERLLKLRPAEPTAHAMLAVLEWKRGDCAAAVQHFEQSQSALASQPDALYGYGACLIRLKRPRDASEIFRQLVSARPDDRPARYALAVAQLDSKQPGQAIAALQTLLDAKDPTALELASAAQEASGDTPRAVALLREAILRDPHNVKLYLDFAALAFAHQSFQVGIDMIAAGLTQSPDSASLYLARGVLYVQLAQFDKADADFDRAERLDPRRTLSGVARGLSQIQQNNLDQALVTVRAQLQARPRDEFLHYVLAELLSRQGAQPGSPEFAEALQAARTAVHIKPDFTLARDVLSRLYLQAGDSARAIEQSRLALDDDPSDEMALYRLIRALQSSGQHSAEIPTLLKRFNALREEARKREAEEGRYRLVEAR